MKITSTQLKVLWDLSIQGSEWYSVPHQYNLRELEKLGLVERTTERASPWRLTPKGINVSLLYTSPDPVSAHSVAPDVNEMTEDGVVVQGQKVESGTLIRIKGRQGKYKFLDTHVTRAGRVVLNCIGPVGMHQAFCACYLEDAKLVPVPRKRRTKKQDRLSLTQG